MRASVIAAAFFAACAQAIKVTTPTKNQEVDLSAGFKVTWDVVSSDPDSAHLYLVNMAGGHTPYSKDLGEVDLKKGSFVVTLDDVTPQEGYQFNIQSVNEDNMGILAQSQQFEVIKPKKTTTTSSSSSTESSASSTITVVSSSSVPADASGSTTLSTTTTGTAGTKASSTASSSTSQAAAPTGGAVQGGSLLALAVGLVAIIA
ncbi:hypothetical protein B0H66DRAFT_536622 [Apodospora peruviana]|uniref:Yeast cell wall synthesis Kre9/Knh1-like N-terminal domain-containing protein n=1 Tax=Apodospora peruviana TaxID=516989 RepID=A0AAE0LZ61_9PEZI|nr:hypothetical protein B0H66DRAFT_536622 [Apodospora peruviana]